MRAVGLSGIKMLLLENTYVILKAKYGYQLGKSPGLKESLLNAPLALQGSSCYPVTSNCEFLICGRQGGFSGFVFFSSLDMTSVII